jgi:hypothetical protein
MHEKGAKCCRILAKRRGRDLLGGLPVGYCRVPASLRDLSEGLPVGYCRVPASFLLITIFFFATENVVVMYVT